MTWAAALGPGLRARRVDGMMPARMFPAQRPCGTSNAETLAIFAVVGLLAVPGLAVEQLVREGGGGHHSLAR